MSTSDWIQAAVAVVQAGLLLVSLRYTRQTIRDAREERRVEGEQRALERKARQAEAAKARQADLEQRLHRVVDRIAGLEELRADALNGERRALLDVGPAKTRLRAAVLATGMTLPAARQVVETSDVFPAAETVSAALSEIEESLDVLAVAARVPFDGE